MDEFEPLESPEKTAIDDLGNKIEVELQALEMNLRSKLKGIESLLFFILVLGIIALMHFW